MALVNPNKANILINFRSDDPLIQTDPLIPENVTFQFNRQINIPATMKAQVSVLNAQIPNSEYTLDEDVTVNWYVNGILDLSTTLPKGHYTVCTFKKKMQDLINISPHPGELPNWLAEGVFDNRLGHWKLQADAPAAPGDVWSLDFDTTVEQKKTLARMLGWRPLGPWPIYSDATGYWESVFVVDFTRSHNFYVCSNTLTPSSVDSGLTGAEWVLAKIPITSPWMSVIDYTGNQRLGCLHESEFLDRVNISIRNHNNELIKLNGVRWNLSLLIEFVDRIPPTVYQQRSRNRRLADSNKQLREMLGKTAALPPPEDNTQLKPNNAKQATEQYKRWFTKQSKKTKKAINRALRSQQLVDKPE